MNKRIFGMMFGLVVAFWPSNGFSNANDYMVLIGQWKINDQHIKDFNKDSKGTILSFDGSKTYFMSGNGKLTGPIKFKLEVVKSNSKIYKLAIVNEGSNLYKFTSYLDDGTVESVETLEFSHDRRTILNYQVNVNGTIDASSQIVWLIIDTKPIPKPTPIDERKISPDDQAIIDKYK